jgi:hypothetical protein
MLRFAQVFLLTICALLGLAACSSASPSTTEAAASAPDVPTLPVGQAAFLISYADW